MPLRTWRQLQRRHTAVQRVHRLRLLRDSRPVGDPAARAQPTAEPGGRALRSTPFTPETTELLRLSFTRIATQGASPDDLSDVLRRVCLESRAFPLDQIIVALHQTWRDVREAHGLRLDSVSYRYRAVMAHCLSIYFGEDIVGLP
jgi:hypothetical protein